MFEKARVGDKAWCIQLGDVEIIDNYTRHPTYPVPVQVKDATGQYEEYTIKGHLNESDVFPSLFWSKPVFEMPQKPKRKVKKVLHGWVNIHRNDTISYVHSTKESARKVASSDAIACVEINQEYEIEE